MKRILVVISSLFFSQLMAQTTVVHRSEYEKVGDEIYDIDDSNEGTINYSITSGNTEGYYTIEQNTGKIKIAQEIPDVFNIVHSDILTVDAGGTEYSLEIVDGYDYFINNLSADYSVLDEHNEVYIDTQSDRTAFNNLWGKGTAVPNVDFRIATIHKQDLSDTSFLIWDVPGLASTYGGSSVWCYNNVFWGNRKNVREDLPNFPFKVESINSLDLQFNFNQLFGDDQFKIAMNMFMTDEPYLTDFSSNDGDFFFVFKQKGTWIPPYPHSLPDTTILNKPFALRYDDQLNGNFYERRRVIIKDNEKLLAGTLDMKGLFDRFSEEGYLNTTQSIYHIQLGVEVTSGYGALLIDRPEFQLNKSVVGVDDRISQEINIYPDTATDRFIIDSDLDKIGEVRIYNSLGVKVDLTVEDNTIDLSGFPTGVYIIKTENTTQKVYKE